VTVNVHFYNRLECRTFYVGVTVLYAVLCRCLYLSLSWTFKYVGSRCLCNHLFINLIKVWIFLSTDEIGYLVKKREIAYILVTFDTNEIA